MPANVRLNVRVTWLGSTYQRAADFFHAHRNNVPLKGARVWTDLGPIYGPAERQRLTVDVMRLHPEATGKPYSLESLVGVQVYRAYQPQQTGDPLISYHAVDTEGMWRSLTPEEVERYQQFGVTVRQVDFQLTSPDAFKNRSIPADSDNAPQGVLFYLAWAWESRWNPIRLIFGTLLGRIHPHQWVLHPIQSWQQFRERSQTPIHIAPPSTIRRRLPGTSLMEGLRLQWSRFFGNPFQEMCHYQDRHLQELSHLSGGPHDQLTRSVKERLYQLNLGAMIVVNMEDRRFLRTLLSLNNEAREAYVHFLETLRENLLDKNALECLSEDIDDLVAAMEQDADFSRQMGGQFSIDNFRDNQDILRQAINEGHLSGIIDHPGQNIELAVFDQMIGLLRDETKLQAAAGKAKRLKVRGRPSVQHNYVPVAWTFAAESVIGYMKQVTRWDHGDKTSRVGMIKYQRHAHEVFMRAFPDAPQFVANELGRIVRGRPVVTEAEAFRMYQQAYQRVHGQQQVPPMITGLRLRARPIRPEEQIRPRLAAGREVPAIEVGLDLEMELEGFIRYPVEPEFLPDGTFNGYRNREHGYLFKIARSPQDLLTALGQAGFVDAHHVDEEGYHPLYPGKAFRLISPSPSLINSLARRVIDFFLVKELAWLLRRVFPFPRLRTGFPWVVPMRWLTLNVSRIGVTATGIQDENQVAWFTARNREDRPLSFSGAGLLQIDEKHRRVLLRPGDKYREPLVDPAVYTGVDPASYIDQLPPATQLRVLQDILAEAADTASAGRIQTVFQYLSPRQQREVRARLSGQIATRVRQISAIGQEIARVQGETTVAPAREAYLAGRQSEVEVLQASLAELESLRSHLPS